MGMLESILIRLGIAGAVQSIRIARKKSIRDRIIAQFRRKRRILVLGTSGVGKSVFVETLYKELVRPIPGANRDTFTHEVSFPREDLPLVLVDTPGQELAFPERDKAYKDAIKDGVVGIINVVCFGYHEGSISGNETQALDATLQPRSEYLAIRREEEIKRLGEWVKLVDSRSAKWVITLVTKADLWYGDYETVMEYYCKGEYSKALGDLPGRIYHTVIPYCSIIEPFYKHWGSGKLGNEQKEELQTHFEKELLRALRRK